MVDPPHLPEELLEIILWQLKLSTGYGEAVIDENCLLSETLLSCLLVNRTFYRLAKPVLYHTINVENLFSAAQYFAQNPSLADLVRELCVDGDSGHDFVQIMDEADDRQWPGYLRDKLSSHRSLLKEPIPPEHSSMEGYHMAIATFAMIVCPKIHTLVLHSALTAPPALMEGFIKECVTLSQAQPNNSHIPLAHLRKIVLRLPIAPGGPDYENEFEEMGGRWFSWLVRLPQINSASLYSLPANIVFLQSSSSSLKRLKITHLEPTMHVSELASILQACPILEYLDLTWAPTYDSTTLMQWAAIGAAIARHGSKLRTLKLDNSGVQLPSEEEPSTLINLASLRHLRILALPVEAILSEPAGEYSVPATDAYGRRLDECASADIGYEDVDDEQDPSNSHAPDHGVNTPTIPLHQLLPHSLRRLRIVDDWSLWADAVRLDMELRHLMLDSQFSELRSIRVRRRIPWSEHVKDLGWHNKRREQYWNVLLRS